MKRSLLGLVAAGGLLAICPVCPAAGQEAHDNTDKPSAYTALRLVGKTLGADAINRVVELTGRDGRPQPTVWKVVLKEGEGSKEIEVVNGRIGAQRPLSRLASGLPIKLPDLNLDSSGAFEATNTQAKKVHLRFDSVSYKLRTSDKTGKPLWSLDLFNESGEPAGTMKISASTGAVASLEGRIATGAAPTASKPVAAGTPPTPPKPTTTLTTATPSAPPRPAANPPVTTATTTVTTVQTAPAQTTVVDIPDAGGPAAPPAPAQGNGFFTRTGRVLDHTSQSVNQSLDHAGQEVGQSVRHAGVTIQHFFTGHRDQDGDARPTPPPAATQPD